MKNITLKQIEIFIMVAKYLSITKAAESLHLSQPAVSRHLRNIELQCDKTLIEQHGKKLYLTKMGELLLQHAKKVSKEIDTLKYMMSDQTNIVSGTISLGMTSSMQHILFDVIKNFSRKYPDTTFEFFIGSYKSQIKKIRDNKADIAITTSSRDLINKSDFKQTTIVNYKSVLVASSLNYLSRHNKCTVDDIANETFITGGTESESHLITMEFLHKIKRKPKKIIIIDNQEAIKNAVQANLGIAFIPNFMLSFDSTEKHLKTIRITNMVTLSSNISCIQNHDKHLSSAAIRFKSFLIDYIRKRYS